MKLTQPTEVYTYFTNLIKLVEKIVLSVSKSPIEDIETNTIIVNFLEKLANTYKCIKYFYLYKENFSPEILDSGLPIYYDYLGLSHADEQAKSIVSEILPKQQYIDIALKKLLSEHTKVDQQTMRGISKHFLLDALKQPRISISECELTESDSKVIISFSVISPLKQLPEFFIIHNTVNKPLTPEDKATIVNTINGTKEISDISVMMFTLDQKCASLKPTKAICFSMAGVYNQYCNTSNEALANSNAVHCIMYKNKSIRSEKASRIMQHSKDEIQLYEDQLPNAEKGESQKINVVFGDFGTIQKIYDSDKSNNIIKQVI